jgi:hypothetical protein
VKKAALLVVFFVVYLILLVGINVLHFWYLTVDVVFYAALADAVIACGIMWCAAMLVRAFSRPDSHIGGVIRQLTNTEIALSALIALLLGYIYAISVPTVIDRSLSIYILEKLEQRGGSIALAAMKDVFIKEYMPEYRLVDVRLTEQTESGTIVVEDGCVRLTPRGQWLAAMTRYYRTHLLPKKRVLMGEVTDDLVDPFSRPPAPGDFRCRQKAPDSTASEPRRE